MPAVARSKPTLSLTPAQAIAEGGILHHAFQGDTWGRWLACTRAAWGETLSPEDEALFREVAGDRAPPEGKVKELWCISGRRSGKDALASAILATTALQNWNPFLRPGERASCICLASTVEQAGIISRYTRSYFTEGPLARFVTAQTDDVLQLSTGAEIIIAAGNFRSIRGKAVAIAVLDEICFWKGTDAANSDTELLAALEPALETLPGSMLVGISSPYKRSGVAYERWARFYGKDHPDILVLHGETRQFNPTVRQSTIDAALEADPDRASSEWLGRWRDDVSGFLDRDLIEAAIDRGVVARAPQPLAEFVMFVDGGGGRGSSFAAAVAHTEGDIVVIDALSERRAPYDPAAVVVEVAALAREYNIGTVTGDRYSASWISEAFAKEGLIYTASDKDKSELLLNVLPMFTSGKIRLLDSPRLSFQLSSLERHVTKFGRDRVSCPTGAADDLANVIAGSAVNAIADGPALIRHASVFAGAVPMPAFAFLIYSVSIIGADGMLATAFFASDAQEFGSGKEEVILLDATLGPLGVDSIYALAARLAALRTAIPSWQSFLDPRAAFVPASLMPQVEADGYMAEIFTETPRAALPALAVQFGGLVNARKFKVCHAVVAKSTTLPLASALSFRPNERIEDNTLRMAILEGVRLGLMHDIVD